MQIFHCSEVTVNKKWANKSIAYYSNLDINFLRVLCSGQVLSVRICTGPVPNRLMDRKFNNFSWINVGYKPKVLRVDFTVYGKCSLISKNYFI